MPQDWVNLPQPTPYYARLAIVQILILDLHMQFSSSLKISFILEQNINQIIGISDVDMVLVAISYEPRVIVFGEACGILAHVIIPL